VHQGEVSFYLVKGGILYSTGLIRLYFCKLIQLSAVSLVPECIKVMKKGMS